MKEAAVIIGRFQGADLHSGQLDLIKYAIENSAKLIILIGVSPVLYTKENPLDYPTRARMIDEHLKDRSDIIEYEIHPIVDVESNLEWSKNVDSLLSTILPKWSITLYGSRDSFIKHYFGKNKTEYVAEDEILSGTEIRKRIRDEDVYSREMRRGIIHGIMNQYPKVYATVDIVIYHKLINKYLLGKKPNEDYYRFVGGFSDPTDENFEAAATREAYEETGLSVNNPVYIKSFKVPDWRYKDKQDQIITTFFIAEYQGDAKLAKASDDIEQVKWFSYTELSELKIMDVHDDLLCELTYQIGSMHLLEKL